MLRQGMAFPSNEKFDYENEMVQNSLYRLLACFTCSVAFANDVQFHDDKALFRELCGQFSVIKNRSHIK